MVMILLLTPLLLGSSVRRSRFFRLEVTCYSPLQKGESKIGMRNNDIRNERGVSISRDVPIHYGDVIIFPNGSKRKKDDTTAKRIKNTVDIRYYESINRKKSINRQLRSLDPGKYITIEVLD